MVKKIVINCKQYKAKLVFSFLNIMNLNFLFIYAEHFFCIKIAYRVTYFYKIKTSR